MRNHRSFVTIALALPLLIWPSSNPVSAKGPSEYVKVPVLFITDREPQADGYGPYRALEKETVSHAESGIAQVSIPVEANNHPADWQHRDQMEHTHAFERPALTKFTGESTEDLTGGFDSALEKLLTQYHTKNVILFAHGFNNSFETAVTKAAELSRSSGCPVICYSWPSVGKLTKYSVDEGNNEWSQEHYNQVMEHLIRLKKSLDLNVALVAHSLGNRLFVRSGPVIANTGLFSDLYLVYPDFDAQTFIHYLARYVPQNGPVGNVHCRLLISRRDKALAISEKMFGGYTRLGQGTDFSLTALTRPDLFLNIWQIPRRLAQLPELPDWMKPEIVARIEEAFKIVDVTAIDSGIIGHKIPYDFIGWMHHQNTPEPGYQFQQAQCQGLNRLASHFEKSSKQEPERLLGKVWLVVKKPPSESTGKED